MTRYLKALRAKGNATRNHFAEAVADGATLREASVIAGVHYSRGKVFWKEIRQRLGWQADGQPQLSEAEVETLWAKIVAETRQ